MDAFDHSQAIEQRERDDAVKAAVARARGPGLGSDICVCCGEPIPEARRRAAPRAMACLPCQTDLEAALAR